MARAPCCSPASTRSRPRLDAPIARFVGFAVAGVKPEIMASPGSRRSRRRLDAAGVRKEQLDWIELNEAFAAQVLAADPGDVGLDTSKVNPFGGAIALATTGA